MISMQSFTLMIAVVVAVTTAFDYNKTLAAPKPVTDRFRIILGNVDEERLTDEIQDFLAYKCERMVVIRNRAHEKVRIACNSHHDHPKQAIIEPNNAYAFTFRPRKSGDSNYWCTIDYQQQYARFDVYNEDLSYMCPRDIDEIYQYVIHHDGVFVDKNNGVSEGEKIRALMKGHNTFILWEEFEDGEADGLLVKGKVDGGMCYDVPEQFNDKTAAVTICQNHCVYLYEHYGCQGKAQIVQANNVCHDAGVSEELGKRISAVKGC